MNRNLTLFFDFFLPRFCTSCKRKLLPVESVICPDCLANIQIASKDRIESEYHRKFKNNNIITGFLSLYVFEKEKELQHLIHSLKYQNRFKVGEFLGKNMGKLLGSELMNWKIDLVIPVPLHQVKKAERGYNQSYYIARGLSKELKIPLKNSIIKRIKFTQSQTTMNLKEREENIQNAFKVKGNGVAGKNILLVDDVITTGATVTECGKALLGKGANKIYSVSAAIADL